MRFPILDQSVGVKRKSSAAPNLKEKQFQVAEGVDWQVAETRRVTYFNIFSSHADKKLLLWKSRPRLFWVGLKLKLEICTGKANVEISFAFFLLSK